MVYVLVCLASLLAALVAAIVARRASRWHTVGDHPHCAHCDHDLTGLPPDSGRCPECGADLRARGASTVGMRRPDRLAQVIAAIVALGGLVGAFVSGRDADWVAARVLVWPSAWLAAELERGNASYAVADALDGRIQSGWLTGAARERAIRAMWTIRATPRRSVRAGDRLPFSQLIAVAPTIPGNRWSQGEAAPFGVYYRLARFRFGTGAWQAMDPSWQRLPVIAISQTGHELPTPADLSPGPVELELVYAVKLVKRDQVVTTTSGSSGARYEMYGAEGPPAVFDWEQTVRAPITVLPADASDDVQLSIDPTLRDAVRASIHFGAQNGDPRGITIRRSDDGSVWVTSDLTVDSPPVAVAFDVLLRDPATGREAELGRITGGPRGRHSHGGGTSPTLKDWPTSRATVVLRPSFAAARGTPTITTIWGEPIVFDDVPVRRSWVPSDTRSTTGP